MKKVLLASTALIGFAGMAAADVTLSGSGRFGIVYTDDPINGDDTVLSHRLLPGLLLAAGPRTRAQDAPALEDLAAFPRASLEISARGGTQRFAVWVADTRARQAQGEWARRSATERART